MFFKSKLYYEITIPTSFLVGSDIFEALLFSLSTLNSMTKKNDLQIHDYFVQVVTETKNLIS